MGVLVLSAQVTDRWSWRWLLTDPVTGTPLADHVVKLDPDAAETQAFADVYRWLRWNAAPDRRLASEAELVARVGAYAGAYALGETIGAAIVAAASAGSVTVHVQVPAGADWLAFLPWELAHAAGRPLASYGDVTFVYDLPANAATTAAGIGVGVPVPAPVGGKAPVEGALRVLGVFSLPTSGSVLGLRRERYELARLVRRVGARSGRRIELAVVQYGVTREKLAELADDGQGWDVLHLSGHGGAGQFLLETTSGAADPVTTEQLVALLAPARRRVKLAVVSACESGAATTAETLRWLGLAEQAEPLEQQAQAEAEQAAAAREGIARAVADRLGCAVVAMRYPVVDDFAIGLADAFYERVLARGHTVDRAVAEAVAVAAGPAPTPGAPALSVGTPAVFGATAIGLTLTPPRGPRTGGLDVDDTRMAGFPPEPARFVGRGPALAAASRVLAPDSTQSTIVFHGMAGAGKTSAALELAYRHREAFTHHAFWQAPTDPAQFGDALRLFALTLEQQLPGLSMVDKIGNLEALTAFLPRLAVVLRDNGILLVLDNLETLLTAQGEWRDPRWAPLLRTLTGHGGESRLVLTTRTPPVGLDPGLVRVQAVHALTRDETLQLARELPHLRALLETEPAPIRDTTEPTKALSGRELARAALTLVQGHPKLLELADAAAADPARLADAVAAAGRSMPTGRLEAFLTAGTTTLDGGQLLIALTAWTRTTLTSLPTASRLLLQVLCAIEEDDRDSFVVEQNWADIWARLHTPGTPPLAADTLRPLVEAALVAATPLDPADPQSLVGYRVHPGIVQTVQADTPPGLQAAVDTELAAWWGAVAGHARTEIHAGRQATGLLVRAGLHAAPYLIRLHDWDTAGTLLERARQADLFNPVTALAVIPLLEAIADATGDPRALGVLAAALRLVDPGRAETLTRDAYAQAAQAGDHRRASAAAGDLANLYRTTGRARQALTLVEEKIAHTRAAGLGPWTQLADHGRRLQLLADTGQHQQVLDQLPSLLETMAGLPDQPGPDDPVNPWNVRETLHDTGYGSALALGRWQDALDHNARVLDIMRARGATAHELAYTRYNDHGPLIELGRYGDADRLLHDCQRIDEEAGDTDQLGKVFSARADLEDARGHHDDAVRLERQALRYKYVRPDPRSIGGSHHNFAIYLTRLGGDPAEQRAHRLAAALLHHLTGDTHYLAVVLRALARDLRTTSQEAAGMPVTLAQVAALVERTDGVHYTDLVTHLTDPATADQVLTELLHHATTLDPDQNPTPNVEGQVARWEPVINAVAAAAATGHTPAELTDLLTQLAETNDWADLAARIGRVLTGDRDRETLVAGLDPVDTAILTVILDRLAQPPTPGTGEDQP
ncbi:MAG TPA: hypothetical protein VFP72_22535 [Kineosporiaceae bacterium]|nr:hypothetical protein [Kineosporiaceae bacterium]